MSDDTVPGAHVLDLLSFLVDKSLLTVVFGDGRARYVMLESVRGFTAQQLAQAGEFTAMARAHAGWLAAVADRAGEAYPKVPPSRWLDEFGPEIDNAREALEWALKTGRDEDALLAGRIVGGLRGLWMSPERRIEGRQWAEAVLDRIDAAQYPLVAAGVMRAHIQSINGSAVFAAAERAIPLFDRIGDRRGLISLHAHVAWEHALRGAFPDAEQSIERAFALADETRVQRSRQYVHLLQARCLIRALARRLDEARADAAAADDLRAAIGDPDLRAHFYWEAFFAFTDGDVRRAAELLEVCAGHARTQSVSPAGPLSELAAARLVLGDVEAAELAARDALELAHFEQLDSAWRPIQHLAAIAALHGRAAGAARLAGFIEAWCRERGGYRGYYEQASYDILMASLREQLTPGALAKFSAEGAQLGFDRAVEEALSL